MSRNEGECPTKVGIFVDDQKWWARLGHVILMDIEFLNGKFGKEKRLKLQQAPITQYLGLVWDRTTEGECLITCPKQIEELLATVETTGIRATPGVEDGLSRKEGSPLLSEARRVIFTTATMKGMYIGKRVRPDIFTMFHCLSRAVTKATEHDWEKLIHLLQYVRGTKHYGLLLKPGDSLVLSLYCDSALGNQYDLSSTSGKGLYHGSSGRGEHNGGNPIDWSTSVQKNRSINSCHSELICLTDSVPRAIEMRNFMIEEGMTKAEDPILVFEDNISCINIAKRGRDAAGPMSRHLDLRAIWFKDFLDRKEMRIVHLRSEMMRADLLTKSAQGKQFHRLLPTLVYPGKK